MKTLYLYQGHGLDVKKGEVMFLLDKTNQNWWNIRKNNGAMVMYLPTMSRK